MFPAHAGMDRGHREKIARPDRVPRTRGDGPIAVLPPISTGAVFPAHAGMDRELDPVLSWIRSVFPAHAGMDR